MVNTALVTASNLEGPTSPAVVNTVVEAGTDVQIEITGPAEVLSDRPVGFKITVTNHGPLVATDVKVVFPIHPAIELADSFYSSSRASGTCERKDGKSPLPFLPHERTEVQCELAEMAVLGVWIIDVNGRAGLLGVFAKNKAEVGIQEADTKPSNNYNFTFVRISGKRAADVGVVPRSLSVGPGGSNHVATVRVFNDGPSDATNVQVTAEPGVGVDLSELVGLASFLDNNEQRADCGGGRSCALDLGSYPVGADRRFELAFNSNAENISIVFRVTASEPDPDPTNNQFDFRESLPKVVTRVALGAGSQQAKLQTLEQPVPILPPPAAVTNSAAGLNFDTVSAGSGHTVWGAGFSSTVRVAEDAALLPIHLEGVKVRLNGIPAPLVFVAGNQINFQTPWELLRDRLAEVRVEVHAATTMRFFVRVAPYDPGIYTTNQSGGGQGAILIANTASLAAPAGMFRGSRPVARGDFISIFCTGLGPVDDPPPSGVGAWTDRLARTQTRPTVTIDGLDARVPFAGLAPGFVALYQVNAQIPQGAATGDAVDLSLAIGGIESNGVTIAISE